MSKYKYLSIITSVFLILGCSTKKNTKTTRMYHEVNTRYNVYFNAWEAYKESLKQKEESQEDNLSRMLQVYPSNPEALEKAESGGPFDVTVDKTTKAIKLHSITAKPARDPGKRKDKDYQQWLKNKEFNPFLKNAWLLLGKSEYQNNDYLLASSTFAYITRLYKNDPEVVMEARIWLARTYVAMDWLYEAEDVFHNIKLAGGISSDLEGEYAEIYADLLMKKKEYAEAIPYLEKAIEKGNSSGKQKLRLKYLLGQTYAHLGNKEKAFAAFQSVQGMSTPYNYSFNAKIQQAAFVNAGNRQQILSQLEKMSKNSKNKEYLDQVFYAIGNIHLNTQDTAKAVDAYKKAIEKSTRNGYDKAIAQIILGDIYFNKKEYVEAQPCYSEAIGAIDKKHESYPRVELRSAVLDELVVYVKAVHLQDSLQTLARMPEDQRLTVISKIITDLKKKEEEERKLAEREANITVQGPDMPFFDQNQPSIPTAPIITGGNTSSFYFYNPQIVNQGKTAFQRKWGNRKLEDDWRRRNKRTSILSESSNSYVETQKEVDSKEVQPIDENTGSGSEQTTSVQSKKETDVYSVDYYLAQIPLTDEAIKKSNEIIEDAYFNMGKIYKDKLEDYYLAIDAFDTDLRRFPNTPNLEEIYYQLFLIYLRLGNKEMTEVYRRNILNKFPKGDYAATLSSPDYEWNLRNVYKIQDNLYQETYDAYLAGKVNTVRNNYQSMKDRYPLSDLMPKFMYLNALTYAQTGHSAELKENLTELIEKYPKADVTEVASEMLKGLLSGKTLSADSSPARGMIWDMKFGTTEQIEAAAGVDFVANPDSEYLLLFIYKSKTVDKNQLIYDIADYNFSNFIYKTFDLSFSEVNTLEMLQVKGFKSFKEIDDYIDLAFEKNSLMDRLDASIITVPISTDNFIALMNGKSLNEYFLFFEKNYTREMVKLILYWNQQRAKTAEEVVEKEPQEELKPSVKDDVVVDDSIDVDTIKVTPVQPIEKPKEPVKEEKTETKEAEIGVGDILSDGVIEKADDVINKAIDIINNPVDGLKGLFNSTKNKTKLTKEEKQAQKEARKKEKAEEKARKDAEKAHIKAEEDALKMKQDSINNAQQQKEAAEKALLESKEAEVKQRIKDKEDARKQRQLELKEKAKAQKEKLKEKEKERKERLKERERQRKEKERLAKEKRKQK